MSESERMDDLQESETDFEYDPLNAHDDYENEKPLIGCKCYVEINDESGK